MSETVVERESFELPRAPAPGVEILAIGDIHGRPDLIEALIEAAANEKRRAPRRELVFLGDIVDRGPSSLEAIRLALIAPKLVGADARHALMGNHETMMRMTLDPATPLRQALVALNVWVRNGGHRVIAEFAPGAFDERDLAHAIAHVRAKAPEFVMRWLEGLEPHARSGGLLFVHAGVNPHRDLESFLAEPWNRPFDRLDESRHWAWVREPFLSCEPGPEGYGGYFVAHGHSPRDLGFAPEHAEQIRRFRLNLDAGSGYTGVAKLAIFCENRVEILTAIGAPNALL